MQELENILMEYFNDNLPQADRQKVEKWAAESNENQIQFDEAKRLFELAEIEADKFNPNVDLAWSAVEQKIFGVPRGKQAFMGLKYAYRVAAVLVFAMTAGLLSYVLTSNDLTTVASKSGEKLEVELPDGTRILLNEESKLRYDESFDDNKRIVYLEGQAFFEVARDVNRPFEIIGRLANISVLGTSFDFLAKENSARVNVYTGKVSFKNNTGSKAELVLTQNQQGKWANNEMEMIEELDHQATAWRFEELVFKSASLAEVSNKLSEFYKVEINLDATIENCLITTSFQNQSLEEVLEVLEIIANIKNERSGNQIQLSGPGC